MKLVRQLQSQCDILRGVACHKLAAHNVITYNHQQLQSLNEISYAMSHRCDVISERSALISDSAESAACQTV